jgi:hypothetical protein
LFQQGEPVYVVHRSEIERHEPVAIAKLLTDAFGQFYLAAQSTVNEQP